MAGYQNRSVNAHRQIKVRWLIKVEMSSTVLTLRNGRKMCYCVCSVKCREMAIVWIEAVDVVCNLMTVWTAKCGVETNKKMPYLYIYLFILYTV